jgi:hypothetical protein
MGPNAKLLFGMPTRTGFIAAGVAIAVFLAAAYGLYMLGGKSAGDFGVKVADYLLQGALVSLLFAVLKGLIDES